MQENLRWTDENRRIFIANKLRKDMAPFPKLEWNVPLPSKPKIVEPKKTEREYEPSEGLVVYWDYCLGLPEEQDYTFYDF